MNGKSVRLIYNAGEKHMVLVLSRSYSLIQEDGRTYLLGIIWSRDYRPVVLLTRRQHLIQIVAKVNSDDNSVPMMEAP
jgi:hypothetical protein